jgi:hypothetical protein
MENMAIQHINHSAKLNDELIHTTHVYLDDRSLLTASRVSKSWHDVPTLKPLRAAAQARLIEAPYPENLARILRESRRPISQLPLLELPNAKKNKYIDYIKFDSVTHPVMRYVDGYGRLAIVFKVQGKGNETIRIPGQIDAVHFEINKIKNTFVIFQRTLGPYPRWALACGNSDQLIKRVYTDRHNRNGHVGNLMQACPTCPFRNEIIADATLSDLLNRRDPLFSLVEKPQEEKKE